MAKKPKPEQAPEPDPEAAGRAKAERLERAKARLLREIAASATNDLRAQVGYVLSHDPAARDSDVRLAQLLWKTFYPEYVDGDWVQLKHMYRLPRQVTITRTRATIQNKYGLFQASESVATRRRALRDEIKDDVAHDKPGPPVISVHADESGKSQPFLVVGSVWGNLGPRWRVVRALQDWKRDIGMTGEFKFTELSKGEKLGRAQAFVKKAMEHADVIRLKACVLETKGLSGGPETQLFQLYYELAMTGVEHEIRVKRVELPRVLHIVKDADAGPDALGLPDLERRLKTACREHFKGRIQVEAVVAEPSHSSLLLQLADLFAGSVARKFNKDGDSMNAKDEFADFFESLAGFDFVKGGEAESDFVYVHRLGVTSSL